MKTDELKALWMTSVGLGLLYLGVTASLDAKEVPINLLGWHDPSLWRIALVTSGALLTVEGARGMWAEWRKAPEDRR